MMGNSPPTCRSEPRVRWARVVAMCVAEEAGQIHGVREPSAPVEGTKSRAVSLSKGRAAGLTEACKAVPAGRMRR